MWSFITPQLPVKDVAEAQRYYRDVLQFQISFTREDSFGAVLNGRTEIFFARAKGPISPTCCCVRVADVEALYRDYCSRGARIVEPLERRPWGMREFTLEDPDGHRFRIGTRDETAIGLRLHCADGHDTPVEPRRR